MKKLKKLVAVVLLSLTLFNSIFTSYSMTVQAAEVAPVSVLESMLSLFGVTAGVGEQFANITNATEWDAIIDAANSGGTYEMSNYGAVDFSDEESVSSWLTWCQEHDAYALGRYGGTNVWDNTVDKVMKTIDGVSYVVSGTVGSTAMNDSMSHIVDKLTGDSEYGLAELSDAFAVCTGSKDGSITWDDWNAFCAMVSAIVMSNADVFSDIVDSFTTPEQSVYTEYAATFGELPEYYFNGDYTVDSSGDYCISCHGHDGTWLSDFSVTTPYKVIGLYVEGSYPRCVFYRLYGDILTTVNLVCEYTNMNTGNISTKSSPLCYGNDFVCNFPIYYDDASALTALQTDDFSTAENIVDVVSYPTFKEENPSMTGTIADSLQGLIDSDPSIGGFAGSIPAILDVAAPLAGTQDYAQAIADAIADVAGMDITNDEEEEVAGGYTGILEEILAVLEGIWEGVLAIPAFLAGILEAVSPMPWGDGDNNDEEAGDSSGGSLSSSSSGLLNGLIALLLILFKLLQIFLHLLEFIVNIFKIPAEPGFIGEGDFATGFNYIKSVKLSPLSISVYDFLMGLIHILIIFGVVGALRKRIDRIHT